MDKFKAKNTVLRAFMVLLFSPVFLFGQAKNNQELTYEEYLLPITIDWTEREPLKTMLEYKYRADSIYDKRKSWRQYDNDKNRGLDYYNEKLKIIDFSIVPSKTGCWHSPSYDLMKGDSIFVAGIELSFSSSFFFNDSTNQFIMLTNIKHANGPPYRENIIITNNFVRTCPSPFIDLICFYKNGILYYEEYGEHAILYLDIFNGNENSKPALVYKNEFTYEHPEFTHKNLIVKNTDWVFEYGGDVVINGINIGKEKGYLKIFSYSYIDDKSFYFYEKDNLIYISYDDKSLPYQYKNVLHYYCCEPSMLNPITYNNMVWFYAQKEDEKWYYVEIGLYE